jgi:cobalt-zinc-cadmium efflux system protein
VSGHGHGAGHGHRRAQVHHDAPDRAHSRVHAHDHGLRASARHAGALTVAFALTLAFLVVQVVTGLVTGSLALLSDAGHMATDAVGLGMALAAIQVATSARDHPQRTFGLYRLEILAALANACLLFGVAAYVVVEAITRLDEDRDVASTPVLVVGAIGLAVNIVAFLLLRPGASESLNLRGAYLEVVSDAFGSVAVIVAAIVWGATGWPWVDPLMGAAIGVLILPRAWRLGRDALRVLVQAAPSHLDVASLRHDLAAIDGVVDVHDLHVWTLTSEMEVATAHVMVAVGTDAHGVLDQARLVLAERHGITHATLQVEPEDHGGCDAVSW